MGKPLNHLTPTAKPILGDPAALTDHLGRPESLALVGHEAASLRPQPVTDLASLRNFLDGYRRDVLGPIELPVIRDTFFHGQRSEIREILALDRRLAREAALKPFAFASQSVGRSWLRRLRPLHDLKVIRRYLEAIRRERACGWHTAVYGIVLSVYSLPLRQGLQSYAHQTLRGFIDSAAQRVSLGPAPHTALMEEASAPLAQWVEETLRTPERPAFEVL
jgi:urease accessory protein UreF